MARRRWTLALILICLPILVTVITAFRLRDLPKSSAENQKLESKKEHTCDGCHVNELNVGQKWHSVNVESAKRSYEELKKAVREKQQFLSETKPLSESYHETSKVENSDEKDVEETDTKQKPTLKVLKLETSTEAINKKNVKIEKPHIVTAKNSDENDKINSDDVIDNDESESKFQKLQEKKPATLVKGTRSVETVSSKIKSTKSHSDNNYNNYDSSSNTKLKSQFKTIQNGKHVNIVKEQIFGGVTKTKNDKNNDNSDNDDDDEYKASSKKILNTIKKPITSVTSKINIKDTKSDVNKDVHVDDDDDDEDDDEDDDDEDDDDVDEDVEDNVGIFSKWFQTGSLMESVVSKINIIKESVLQKTDDGDDSDDNDDDDDDDEDDDDNDVDDDKHDRKSKLLASYKTSALKTTDKLNTVKLNQKEDMTYKTQHLSSKKSNYAYKYSDNENVKNKEEKNLPLSRHIAIKDETMKADSKSDKAQVKIKIEKTVKQNDTKPMYKTKKEENMQRMDAKFMSESSKADFPHKPLKKIKTLSSKPITETVKVLPKTKLSKQQVTETIDASNEHKIVKEKKIDESKKFENKITPAVINDDNKTKDKSKEPKQKQDANSKLLFGDNIKRDKETIEDSREIFSKNRFAHVTEALHRRILEQSEFEDFYAFFPTFAPNFSRIHNPECRRHGQILLRQLRGTKLWALNMLDATAKIPSGILQGNGIQLGNFDQCLGSRARVQLDTGSVVKVQGKYCLARLDLKAEHPDLEVPVHLAQAKNLLKSRIDDPGHFVPRFSTLSWGICLPAACGPEDVEVVVKDALKHYQHTSGIAVRVKVEEQDCFIQELRSWEDWLEWPTIVTLSLYAVVLLLVAVYTVQDFLAGSNVKDGGSNEADDKAECDQKDDVNETDRNVELKKSDDVLSAFSLYRSTSKLLAPAEAEEISCIHGVRAVATVALLVVHKFLPVAVIPYSNRTKITELVSSPVWSWSRAGWVFTDCFLLLSGTLTAHRCAAGADTSALTRLFSRYLRLTPALLAVVLFYSYVWDRLSTGPMWGTLVTKNAEVCREGWWWNLLYVQNYFGFEDICAPQTHQLALDMQLTVLGGIVVWLMTQVKPRLSSTLLPSLHVVAAYSRYTTVRDHRLTLLFYHGVSVSQLYRTARLSYTSALHRSTAYLMGITLGMALQKPAICNKFLLTVGWLSCVSLWGGVWWAGMDSGSLQYHYRAEPAALYAALAPVASAAALAWFIYAVHNGHSEFLLRILCCRPLVLISRLSYALYLIQFAVFLTNAATIKSSSEFSLVSLIDIQELATIFFASTILTLTFIIPMQSLHKVFIFEERTKNKKDAVKGKDLETKEENNVSLLNVKANNRVQEIKEVLPLKNKVSFVAHREPLEEIPEVEKEYEMRREMIDGLDEILEEEEDEDLVEDDNIDEEEPEVMEEGSDDDYVEQRREFVPRRRYYMEDEQDLEEWEWTKTDGPNGGQNIRFDR